MDIAIVSAKRTAVGSFLGALSTLSAAQLGAIVIKDILAATNINPSQIDEVILGQILTAGCGQNPARQAAIFAGIPHDKTAFNINQLCGSGLRAVAMGFQAIALGDANIMICGGQESMSRSAHTIYMRNATKMGDGALKDTMLTDGLLCAINGYHMGNTAENIAKKYNITRQMQDEFACASQNKAEAAQKSGKFASQIVPVVINDKKGDITILNDEYPKHGTTMESLGKLRPAFDKDGTVTAGNASGINDGAAAVMLMSASEAKKRNLPILTIIKSWATAGVDASVMGTGPIPATRLALKKAGWNTSDLDLIEANEAFAAQALSVNMELGLDSAKVNVNGGAIALGHPIGASGARVLVSLIHELNANAKAKKGLATLCIGGGMGIALCVEKA